MLLVIRYNAKYKNIIACYKHTRVKELIMQKRVDKAFVKNEHYAISLFGIPYRGCKRDAPKHISSIRSLSAPLYLPQY